MKQNELENYLWGAATLLRGVIDPGDYKQYIFPLLFYKRICDVFDEEKELSEKETGNDYAEYHRFKIPEGSHWKDIRRISKNIGMAIQKAMETIEKTNKDVLYGIFGDAAWTNKQRLSDEILIDLIEHFSQKKLTIQNVPDDKLGDGYEFLIKKFADDSGHTAAEFYTNRTVVQLMTKLMDPKPGESVYDPTCGSGGMLLNCALELKRQGKEFRSLKLYGQEINLITSSIARMNMFMHGIEDFQIDRGDTLKNPAFIENDELKKFNVILANPPYSIKRWDRNSFEHDPYGRNMFGTPPQGCADYAFQQHILKSSDKKYGRSVVLWPHGILFRDQEKEIRRKLIEADLIEAVIGLGPNLFYNSPMEACLLICKNNKIKKQKNNIFFINAINDVENFNGLSYLTDINISKIYKAYKNYMDIEGFAKIVSIDEILKFDSNLTISLYISNVGNYKNYSKEIDIKKFIKEWKKKSNSIKSEINNIFNYENK
ncbi:SAM-dependent DNA methyltransferase [Candidatus Parcubacteria bacterium]|nr:MAG: SAM-dependent DNA methyltransferase [Candidatus Parcubacteria bacterium]